MTGVQDLVGNDAQDNIRNDLNLARTPSNSSSSSGPSTRPQSRRSVTSTTLPSRNVSSVSLAGPPNLGYKSFEHHLRPEDTVPPPRPRNMLQFKTHHHHHSHHLRSRPPTSKNIHELPPEVIIEAIFNPHPANEETPFTFVPPSRQVERVDPEVRDGNLNVGDLGTGDEKKEGGKLGWASRMRARKERREKERMARVVSGPLGPPA